VLQHPALSSGQAEEVSQDLLGNSPDAKSFAKRKLVLMEYMQKVKDAEFTIVPQLAASGR